MKKETYLFFLKLNWSFYFFIVIGIFLFIYFSFSMKNLELFLTKENLAFLMRNSITGKFLYISFLLFLTGYFSYFLFISVFLFLEILKIFLKEKIIEKELSKIDLFFFKLQQFSLLYLVFFVIIDFILKFYIKNKDIYSWIIDDIFIIFQFFLIFYIYMFYCKKQKY